MTKMEYARYRLNNFPKKPTIELNDLSDLLLVRVILDEVRNSLKWDKELARYIDKGELYLCLTNEALERLNNIAKSIGTQIDVFKNGTS